MDPDWKGITWVGNIFQKFEDFCLEVDDIMSQESVEYVQNQIQTVGANVKQFCSEFVQDVLSESLVDSADGGDTDSSLVQNIDSLACEKSMVNNSENAELESGAEINLLRSSSVELVEEEHLNSCLGQTAAMGMDEKSKEDLMESPRKEKKSLSEMSELEVADPAETSSSMASLSSGHHDDCESELNSQALSCPISIDLTVCKSSMTAVEIGNNLVDTSASISSTEPPSNYVMEAESQAFKVPDVGHAPLIGAFSAKSIESSDDSTSEEADNTLTMPGMETIQLFDESCILVDSNEYRSHKKKLQKALRNIRKKKSAKKQQCEQQAASFEDLDAGAHLHTRKSSTESTLTTDSKSSIHDFSESEWEII